MNTNINLKKANSYRSKQDKLRNKALTSGVNLIAPETTFLSNDTVFGRNIDDVTTGFLIVEDLCCFATN